MTDAQRKYLREATKRYNRSLEGSPDAVAYLERRGLGDPNVSKYFQLGFVDDPLLGHEMYRGFLAIPYLRPPNGDEISVVSIRFRCIRDHEHKGHGKYMTVAGDRPRLYNTSALMRRSPTIAITEGEIDAISLHTCRIPTVGVPGTQAWAPHFREPFLGYREVFILADGDEPGMQFATTVAKTLPNAKVIPSPAGEDINSILANHGESALLERLR